MKCNDCPIIKHLCDVGNNPYPNNCWCPIIQKGIRKDEDCREIHVLDIEEQIWLWRQKRDSIKLQTEQPLKRICYDCGYVIETEEDEVEHSILCRGPQDVGIPDYDDPEAMGS